jgi:hypothetical protein
MGLVSLILGVGFFALNVVAVYKIITKAGYSGNWILLFLAPFVAYLIGLVVLFHDIRSGSFHAARFADWFGLAGLLLFIEYIFFLVFAFSEWPALRQRRQGGQSYGPGYRYGGPGPVPPSPGMRPGVSRPVAGNRLAVQPRSWPDAGDESPGPQSNRWPDPWGRPRQQRSAHRGPQSPPTGQSEGTS